jgi:outer membrane protein W
MQRRILLVLFALSCFVAHAQKRKTPSPSVKAKSAKQDNFLQKQLWVGFKAGANFSEADPIKRYTVLTPTNYSAALADKKYTGFSKAGSQATLEITYQYKNFFISTQPTYRQSRFSYTNQFEWKNLEDFRESLVENYVNEQKVNYIDLPLFLKYTIGSGKLRPFIQVGIYYSFLINATQTVSISGTDVASGGTNQFSNEPVIVGAKGLFTNYWGLTGGIGATYQLGNVQLVLDASYRKGMSNIADTKNRYNNDRLAGIGDVPDDIKLNNIVINAGILFPMRFLSSNFKSFENR